jgi:hypothetical protein
MNQFNVFVVLSIVAATSLLAAGAMVTPVLAVSHENATMSMDNSTMAMPMDNMTMTMDNSTDMGNNATMTVTQ